MFFTPVCHSVHRKGLSPGWVSIWRGRGSLSGGLGSVIDERAVRILLECILIWCVFAENYTGIKVI